MMFRYSTKSKKTKQKGHKRSAQALQSLRERQKNSSKPLEDLVEEVRREHKRNLKRRKEQIINHSRRANR